MFAGQETRALPLTRDRVEMTYCPPWIVGPIFVGATSRRANRTRPCCRAPATRVNSPPYTTYLSLAVMSHPACEIPDALPVLHVGYQCSSLPAVWPVKLR